LLNGFTDLRLEVYLVKLIGTDSLTFLSLIILSIFIHSVVNNRYIGYFLFIAVIITNSFVWPVLDVSSNLVIYGGTPTVTYSDMNGFGDYVKPFQIYLLHWTLTGIFLLGIAYLFLARGAESNFKARLQLAKGAIRYSGQVKAFLAIAFLTMMASGFYITYTTLKTDRLTNSKTIQEASIAYEKKFGYLRRSLHPSLRDVKVEADMFPENGDLRLGGSFVYYNPHKKPIDTLWYNLQSEGTISRFDLSSPAKLVFEDKPKGIRAYRLQKSLAPGDSFHLNFEMKMAYTGLNNESPVIGNGTFFNNSLWPSVGFNDAYEISDEDKRKENGLKEIPPMPRQNDSAAIAHSLFDYHNHSIRFEAILSTSPDQMAIAPGYLQKEWTDKGRRYFHYKMDRPITVRHHRAGRRSFHRPRPVHRLGRH